MSGKEEGVCVCMLALMRTFLGLTLCIYIGGSLIDFLLVEVGGGEVPSDLTLTPGW